MKLANMRNLKFRAERLVGSSPTYAILINVAAEHWRVPKAVTFVPSGCAGSTPARYT